MLVSAVECPFCRMIMQHTSFISDFRRNLRVFLASSSRVTIALCFDSGIFSTSRMELGNSTATAALLLALKPNFQGNFNSLSNNFDQ